MPCAIVLVMEFIRRIYDFSGINRRHPQPDGLTCMCRRSPSWEGSRRTLTWLGGMEGGLASPFLLHFQGDPQLAVGGLTSCRTRVLALARGSRRGTLDFSKDPQFGRIACGHRAKDGEAWEELEGGEEDLRES